MQYQRVGWVESLLTFIIIVPFSCFSFFLIIESFNLLFPALIGAGIFTAFVLFSSNGKDELGNQPSFASTLKSKGLIIVWVTALLSVGELGLHFTNLVRFVNPSFFILGILFNGAIASYSFARARSLRRG